MVKVADLQADRRTCELQVTIGTNMETQEPITSPLTVTYRPSAYTARMELQVNAAFAGDWKALGGLTWVHNLVLDWDLEYGEGEKHPLWIEHPSNVKEDGTTKTEKEGYDEKLPALAALPSSFITEVMVGVSNDMGGRRAPSNDS